MVVGESQIHNGADDDLAVAHDRAVRNGVHPQHRALGRVDNRGGENRAVHAAVGNGKGPPFQIGQGNLVVFDLPGKVGDGLLNLGEMHLIRTAQHRHHQPLFSTDSNPDMVVVIREDIVAVDAGVDFGEGFKGLHAGFHKKRHQPQLDAMTLLKTLLMLFAQGHNPAHIGFVEGGQHGGLLPGRQQPLGDALADR